MKKLTTVVMLVMSFTLAGRVPASASPDCTTRPEVGAHRGAPVVGSGYTENGMPAFLAAWDSPDVGYVETDLRRTADHQILVMHDQTIDRTTNGSGVLSTMTYAQATAHRLDDGSRIPGATTFLDALRRSGKGADLELKNLGPKVMRKFVTILNRYPGLADKIRVTSLLTSQLSMFRSYVVSAHATKQPVPGLPWWQTVLIVKNESQDDAAKATGQYVQVYHPADVFAYVAAGMTVEADGTGGDQWTTDLASPVERILTNDPAGFSQWWTAACEGAAPAKTQKNYPYSTAVTD